MVSLTGPHTQFAAPDTNSSELVTMYAPSLIFASDELAESEEIVSIHEVEMEPLFSRTTSLPVMTKPMRRKKSIQFLTLCMALFFAGWSDATIGPLIPRIQEVYHVGYAVVSLLFIAPSIGYMSGAVVYVYVTDRFGFGVVVVVASIVATISASIQAFAPPFPTFVIACFLVGFATIFLNGGATAYVASMTSETSVSLSVMYTAYGVAAICAPLVSTQFARLPWWSSVFLVNAGLAVTTAILQALAFKFKSQEDCLKEIGERPLENNEDSDSPGLVGASKYKRILRTSAVHLMALFLFTHVGIEVTVSGWIVTFMTERHGGLYSGYIASGFWAGSTVGRLALLPLTKKLGEWRALYVYIAFALALESSIWLVSSFAVSAAAVVLIGFFFGPIYATVMVHTGRVLPRELIASAVSWMAIFTAAGSAVFPFIAGAAASRAGMESLPSLLIMMQGATLVIWAFVPKHRAKST